MWLCRHTAEQHPVASLDVLATCCQLLVPADQGPDTSSRGNSPALEDAALWKLLQRSLVGGLTLSPDRVEFLS